MGNSVSMTEIMAVFEAIRASFPHLKMELKRNDKQVDLRMHIPRQRGLAFDVNVNLRGGQLHLRAGACTLKWFPRTSADVVARFREAVQGVLSGNFRIVEHCRLGRPIRAELQKPQLHSWQTIGTWRRLHLPWGKKSLQVLQNADGADPI
jgi:hypothetical protein